jgi:hypothetical protein
MQLVGGLGTEASGFFIQQVVIPPDVLIHIKSRTAPGRRRRKRMGGVIVKAT